MASARFRLGYGSSVSGPWTWGSYGSPIDVAAGNYVKIELESTVGVNSFTAVVSSADDVEWTANGLPAVTVDQASKTGVFHTSPYSTSGFTFIVRVLINGGVDNTSDAKRIATAAYEQRLAVHSLTTGGLRLMAVGETLEAHSTYGYTPKINAGIRGGGGGSTITNVIDSGTFVADPTAAPVTVSTSLIAATDIVIIGCLTPGGTQGGQPLTIGRTVGASFQVGNDLLDASTYGWALIRHTGTTNNAHNHTSLTHLVTGASANQVVGINAAASASEYKSILGTTNNLTVTHSVGGITLNVGTYVPTFAGASAPAKGDTIYASATNTWAKLPIGTSGQFLTVSAGVPAWTSVTPGDATSIQGYAVASGAPANHDGWLYSTGASEWQHVPIDWIDGVEFDLSGPSSGYVLSYDGSKVVFSAPGAPSAHGITSATHTISGGSANQTIGINSGATGLEYKTLTGTTNHLNISNSAGAYTFDVGSNVVTKDETYSKGDIWWATASNTLGKLTVGSAGQVLTVGSSSAVTWATPTALPSGAAYQHLEYISGNWTAADDLSFPTGGNRYIGFLHTWSSASGHNFTLQGEDNDASNGTGGSVVVDCGSTSSGSGVSRTDGCFIVYNGSGQEMLKIGGEPPAAAGTYKYFGVRGFCIDMPTSHYWSSPTTVAQVHQEFKELLDNLKNQGIIAEDVYVA